MIALCVICGLLVLTIGIGAWYITELQDKLEETEEARSLLHSEYAELSDRKIDLSYELQDLTDELDALKVKAAAKKTRAKKSK